MAEEQIVTNIVANADFSNLIADVNRVTASLSEMQQKLAASNKALDNQIKVINTSFAETLRSTGQYSTHFLTLTSDVEKFGRNLDAGRLKLRDYFRVYQDHQKTSSGLIRDLAKQQTQLQNAILQPLGRNAQGLMQFNVHVPRGLDLIKNKTGLAKLELQIMNKVIQDGAVQLINWGKNTQWAGRQLTVGLTVPLAMFGKAAADAFKTADQELTRLTKVYGDVAGTSAEELGKIRKEVTETARELSATMGVGFNETIALAADIAATGKTGNELLGALTETTRLAVLGEVDRAEAMKATLAIQTAFKQNTEELSASINFLNAVENQTSTSLNDLVEAIPKAGPVVKQLGGDIQDLALYLTAMREGGINASESANALKSGLASLINPTKQTVGVMSDFGIDILGMVNKNAGNTTSLLFDLQGALDNLDPLQKAQAIEQLFGKFQFARISALLNNLGRQGSQTLQVLDLMGESAGNLEAVAGRELAAVTESASGRYRRAIEGLKADLAGVGEQFLTISTNLINFVDGIVDFANKLPKPVKQALALVGGITAIAGPLIMLTGVLANFFGYIVKGLSHMRALFKGGEGFRLLTPEILAAERAGSLIEKTFYNDAQAASILNTALKNLIDSFTVLQSKAAAGQFSVNPAVSTMAGNAIVASSAAGRVVDPNNPFLGRMGSRSSAHMNPRDPDNPATMFGLVPSTGPVNLKVGRNPMFYSGGDIPSIKGVTSFNRVSSGIYAPEAARWHALMATLGMQTRQEMENLKDTIASGGAVSREIMTTFDDILPLMSNVTDNAAKQTALIVAEMQAGKLTIAQARERIMALNAQVEAELVRTAQMFAASRGRTIDVTKVPGLDQPVVDLSGKSNMRELFHKGRSARMMEALGRATRTRMYGGPYNIETTRPQGLNDGEFVYMTNGQTVPGPNVNADVVPAMLTPGEFVLTRDVVAQQGSDAVEALHRGEAMIVPFGANQGGEVPGVQYLNNAGIVQNLISALGNRSRTIGGLRQRVRSTSKPGEWSSSGPSSRQVHERNAQITYHALHRPGSSSGRSAWGLLSPYGQRAINTSEGDVILHGASSEFRARFAHLPRGRSATARIDRAEAERLGLPISSTFEEGYVLPDNFVVFRGRGNRRAGTSFNTALDSRSGASTNLWPGATADDMTSLAIFLKENNVNPSLAQRILEDAARRLNQKVRSRSTITGDQLGDYINESQQESIQALSSSFNRGGMVPGYKNGKRVFRGPRLSRSKYNAGGKVPGYNYGGTVGRYNYSSIARKYRRGGGVVRNNRRYYGDYQIPGYGPLKFAGPELMASAQRAGLISTEPQAPSRGRMMGAGIARMGIGTAGFMLGSQLTGGSMFGGMLGGILGDIGGTAAYNGIVNYNKAVLEAEKRTSLFKKAVAGFRSLPGPLQAISAVATLGLVIKNVSDQIKANREIIDQGFAPTSDTIDKLNLKFKTTSDMLTQVKENMDAMRASGQAFSVATEGIGVSGVSLTIKEFDELSSRVKSDFPDLIEVFNKAKPDEVLAKAEQLKAQFVAGGMSAQDATNFIYTLIKASNDATMATYAISTKGFKEIENGATAASSAIKTFVNLTGRGNRDQIVESFDTAAVAINLMKSEIMATKDENGNLINESEALAKTFEEVGKVTNINKTLTSSYLKEFERQNPIYKDILGNAETLMSIYAKTELYAKGITKGLQNLNQAQATSLLQVVTAMQIEFESTSGPFAALAKDIQNLEKSASSEKMVRAVQKNQDQIKKEIELRQKNIQKIKEEADAKLQALDREREDEDDLLQIRKLQLQYQNQIAAGNLEAAAQTAIDIQRSVGDRQSELARRAIEDKAESRIKEEESAIEALQKQLDRSQKKIDAANKKAEENSKVLADRQALMMDTITAMQLAEDINISKEERDIIEDVQDRLRKLGYESIAEKISPIAKPQTVAQADAIDKGFVQSPIVKLYNDTFGKVTEGNSLRTKITNINELRALLAGNLPTTTVGSDRANPILVPASKYRGEVKGAIDTLEEVKKIVGGENLRKGTFISFRGQIYEITSGIEQGQGTNFNPTVKKFHNWNGAVPGPYNQEVSAVLKAGTEGVYQQSYINSLRNDTMGNTIMVDKVVMKFPETPENGKQMFAEFKEAMRVENLKKGGTVRI